MECWHQVRRASQFQRNHQISSEIAVRRILCANSKPSWCFWCVMNLDPNCPLDKHVVTNAGLILLKQVHFAVQIQDIQRCAYASSWLQFGLSWKVQAEMFHPPELAACCEGKWHIEEHMARSQVDGSWPSLACMQQLLPSTFTKITNGLLGNPILEVSIDAAEGEALPCTLTSLFDSIVGKSPIVAVVM